MPRPKDLPPALQSWATGNYSAGPTWGGTPQRTPPGASFLTPNLTLPAEVANYLHGNAFDAVVGIGAYLYQLPALNWFTGAAIAFDDIVWNGPRRTWFAVGNGVQTAKIARESYSNGQGFAADVLSGLGGAAGTIRIAADAAGNMVVTTVTSVIYEYNFATVTWSYQSAAFSMAPAAGDAYAVAHDGTRWVAFTAKAGSGFQYRSSTDRVTWTNRTVNVVSSATASMNMARLASNGAGRMVSVTSIGATGASEFLATTDGGATFIGGTYSSLNHGLTAILTQSLTYNAASGLFIFTCSSASAAKVYTSTDGLSWSLVATLATGRIQRIVTAGELWLAFVGVGTSQLALSVDRGVTWRVVGWWPDAFPTPTALASSGDQFMMTTTAGPVFYTLKTGIGLDVLT